MCVRPTGLTAYLTATVALRLSRSMVLASCVSATTRKRWDSRPCDNTARVRSLVQALHAGPGSATRPSGRSASLAVDEYVQDVTDRPLLADGFW